MRVYKCSFEKSDYFTVLQMPNKEINISIFASGAGTNAQKLIDHFKKHSLIKIALIVCNKKDAGVLKIANKENIPCIFIERKNFYDDGYVAALEHYNINWIVLAGFLWKVPLMLIKKFNNRIINIHPALLPKYGGKNMYGNFVHEAVLKNKETESGITIHYVDEIYDNGKIIFQAKCKVDESESLETLSKKIRFLEHNHYPSIIEKIISF